MEHEDKVARQLPFTPYIFFVETEQQDPEYPDPRVPGSPEYQDPITRGSRYSGIPVLGGFRYSEDPGTRGILVLGVSRYSGDLINAQ